MKTKVSKEMYQSMIEMRMNLAKLYHDYCNEWINDTNEKGYVKLHSKCHNLVDKSFKAYEDIDKLIYMVEVE